MPDEKGEERIGKKRRGGGEGRGLKGEGRGGGGWYLVRGINPV